MKPYHANIESQTKRNSYYRKVVYTTPTMQLVLMSLRPGEEIGLERHKRTTQFIRVESGRGIAVVSGKQYKLEKDTAIMIPQNKLHNIVNTGRRALKLYTIYSPPEHPKGRRERQKRD